MPGWHKRTLPFQKAGRVQLVGIIQEQHPERCRLFMQWQKMSWPILVDSLDINAARVVPQVIGLDEHGVVRVTSWRGKDLEKDFLDKSFPAPAAPAAVAADKTVSHWRQEGDQLFLWGGPAKLDQAIADFEKSVKEKPQDGAAWFRLGVAYRRRLDSPAAHPGDFQQAVDAWTAAEEIDPNQYIWMRRIQQFGPILAKPYPFYGWIARAQKEIRARGETPSPLTIPLTSSELAHPGHWTALNQQPKKNPDPGGRITRDKEHLVNLGLTMVPGVGRTQSDYRLHITLSPNAQVRCHWNNESTPLRIWAEAPAGLLLNTHIKSWTNPPKATSGETRRLEFEIRRRPDAPARPLLLKGFALYNVCEDVDGQCLFRRQDFQVLVPAPH